MPLIACPRPAVLTLLSALALLSAGQLCHAEDPPARFFEMRVYTAHPGKLAALNTRFRDHTNRLFKKHGMQIIGFWTPADGEEKENTLVYMLAYPSREARDKAWQGFRSDKEWQQAFAASRADGPLVKKVESKFLHPTDYSPIR